MSENNKGRTQNNKSANYKDASSWKSGAGKAGRTEKAGAVGKAGQYDKSGKTVRTGQLDKSDRTARTGQYDKSERTARAGQYDKSDRTARAGQYDKSDRTARTGQFGRPDGSARAGQYDKSDRTARTGQYDKSERTARAGQYDKSDRTARAGQYDKSDRTARAGQYDKSERTARAGQYDKSERTARTGQYDKSERTARAGQYDKSERTARAGQYDKSDRTARTGQYDKSERTARAGQYDKSDRTARTGQYGKSDGTARSGRFGKSDKLDSSVKFDRTDRATKNDTFDKTDKKIKSEDKGGYGKRDSVYSQSKYKTNDSKAMEHKQQGQAVKTNKTASYKKVNTSSHKEIDIDNEDYFEDLDYSMLSKEDMLKYGQKNFGKKPFGRNNSRQEYRTGQKNQENGRPILDNKSGKDFSRSQSDMRGSKFVKPGSCPYIYDCGGCNILQQSYEEELKEKQSTVEALLSKYCKVEPIIGMKEPKYYRNKVHVVFDHDKKGNPLSGVYEEGTHRVVPVEKCLIHNQKADAIIATIRGMLKSFKIKTYDEDSDYGLLRHVLIRTGFATSEVMVVLVLVSPILPSKNNFVKALREKHPEVTTVIINVNDKKTSMVLGDKEQVIYGKGYIEDKLCEKVFRISSKSFYQVNPAQTEVLYKKAIELAGLVGNETVIDAYCGTGTIGIIASDHAKKVIGVELNKDAVRDANVNAKRNDAHNIDFYSNDAGVFMSQMAAQNEKADVVFMDPPRSGSSEQFLESLTILKPKKIVYISCNPITLDRDLAYITKKGYKAKKVIPVDMFPWTTHVETCCLLYRVK